jgi:hypothetical protein
MKQTLEQRGLPLQRTLKWLWLCCSGKNRPSKHHYFMKSEVRNQIFYQALRSQNFVQIVGRRASRNRTVSNHNPRYVRGRNKAG